MAKLNVARLSLIQASLNTAAKINVLLPIENKQRSFNPIQLLQCNSQSILTRIAIQLTNHQQSSDSSLL